MSELFLLVFSLMVTPKRGCVKLQESLERKVLEIKNLPYTRDKNLPGNIQENRMKSSSKLKNISIGKPPKLEQVAEASRAVFKMRSDLLAHIFPLSQ